MRFLFALIIVYAAIIVFGGVANANKAEDAIAVQTTGWSIMGLNGAQEVSLNPENCLMQTQYDNGVQITFKATGKKLTALRIQSMQSGMDLQNFVGFVGLGVGKNSYALQSKTTNGQIDATLLTVPNLVKKLKDATVFRLKLGTENTYFALQGFDDGYHRLMVCMGLMPTKTLQVVDHAKGMPRPPIATPQVNGDTVMPSEPIEVVQAMELGELLPMEMDATDGDVSPLEIVENDIDVNDDAAITMPTPITPQPKMDNNADAPSVFDDAEKVIETVDAKPSDLPEWRAFKGQKLSSVLIAWSEQQGIETHIAMDRNPVLTKDIVSNGSFEMAVNTLLKQTGVANGASAIVKNGDGRVTHVAGYQGGSMINKQASSNNGAARWRALQGSDVRKVLMQWSAKEDVDFVWDAPEIYLVRQSLKAVASYEDAVALLLNQFNGQPTRPVAQLNRDPDTGRTSLIIKTNRAG